MSLADDWDAIPAAAPARSSGSLADAWDSIKPDEAAAAIAKRPAHTTTPIESTYSRVTSMPSGAEVADAATAVPKFIANQVTGAGASILGGWRGLATLASGGSLDDATKAVHETVERGTYQPEGGSGAAIVHASQSPYNPLNVPAAVASKLGDVTMDVTGSPAAATAVETGVNAIPLVLIRGGKGTVARAEPKVVGSGSIADEARPAPPAQVTQAENLDVPTIFRRREAMAAGQPAAVSPAVASAVETPQAAAAAAEKAAPKFEPTAPTAEPGAALPTAEQARRAGVLQRIGLTDARESAVTGDPIAASTDVQTAKLDTDAGRFAKAKLDEERAALTGHAEQIVADTGGTLGTDSQSLEARGHAIVAPLDALKDWFDSNTKALYQAADQQAKGVPAEMPNTKALIGGDQAEFLGTTEGEDMLRGVKARMKSLGMTDAEGEAAPATVQQAEQLKQYLNNQWQPRTAKLIRSMKDAIDDDVTQAAGGDIYAKARAMRKMRAVTLDDPNGIAKVMDASGPEGINRSVPTEKIPDAITALPNAQFAHVVKTLQSVPAELQPQAQAALSEIKAQFANRMRDAGVGPNGQPVQGGQWRARGVTEYLNKNAAKMAQVFTPDELANVRDLNDAGHILAKDASYPGAAVQAHNLLQRGAMAALPKVGAATGATLGAILGAPGTGALIGEAAGSGLAGKLANAGALKATQKRYVKLSDFLK